MQDLLCTWVPGTLDVVRLNLAGRTLELKATRLIRIFGPQALNDLYLRGRAKLRADSRQVALLA